MILQALLLVVADLSWTVQGDSIQCQRYNSRMEPLPEARPLDLDSPEQQPGRL